MLHRLDLTNFKSHTKSTFVFQSKINIFIGQNGVGKTNVLDAIYYLAVYKSFLNHLDNQLMHFGQDFFRLEGQFDPHMEVVVKYNGRKRMVEVNDVKVAKLSERFGEIPVVVASPADVFLLFGGSEDRRKFIDYTISMESKEYLLSLNLYNAFLDQRNAYLKTEGTIEETLIAYYNAHLIKHGEEIFSKRKIFLEQFIILCNKWYARIAKSESNSERPIEIVYQSQLHVHKFEVLLKTSQEKDRILQRTTKGIHRDDIEMSVEGIDVKKIASQGQQKSLLYAIRFAQAEWIFHQTNKKAYFLLDDLSDKLDINRKKNLLQIISEIDFVEQWFLTDTKEDGLTAEFEIFRFLES